MRLTTPDEHFIARCCARFGVEIDRDWSIREQKLFILHKFLDNSIYDKLAPFNEEFSGGNYIPLNQRRPSVIFPLPKIIVNDSVAMLFGDEHFPVLKCPKDHESTINYLDYMGRESKLNAAMVCAAKRGSCGSVCVLVKVINRKFYFDSLHTRYLNPIFDWENPGILKRLQERRKLDGYTLRSIGYSVKNDNLPKPFIVIREWTTEDEIYYKPYLLEDEQKENFRPSVDNERSSKHGLGFLPAIWIKNVPACEAIDGECTFEAACEIAVEISYQLSQHGRLLRYNADPTLVIKEPSSLEGNQIFKGIGTLNLDSDGDAYLLEMKGSITDAVLAYCEKLRKYALESVRGNRSDPDMLKTAMSGKALQFLNHPLISLVSEMRLTYGDGLLAIYKMVLAICQSNLFDIDYGDAKPNFKENCGEHLELDWPDWYPQTSQDDLQEAQTTVSYLGAGVISKQTATESVADKYHIADVSKEVDDIQDSKDEEMQKQQQMAAANKPIVNKMDSKA